MDPNATLNEIISTLLAKEWDECSEHCDNLGDWLSKLGFVPTQALGFETGFTRVDLLGFIRVCRMACARELERVA